MSELRSRLFVSLSIAGAGLLVPPALFLLGDGHIVRTFYPASLYWSLILFPAAWLVALGLAWYRHRWRGMWLLIGAPLVFAWPVFQVMFWWACAVHGECL